MRKTIATLGLACLCGGCGPKFPEGDYQAKAQLLISENGKKSTSDAFDLKVSVKGNYAKKFFLDVTAEGGPLKGCSFKLPNDPGKKKEDRLDISISSTLMTPENSDHGCSVTLGGKQYDVKFQYNRAHIVGTRSVYAWDFTTKPESGEPEFELKDWEGKFVK